MSGRVVWKFPVSLEPLAVMFTQVVRIPKGARLIASGAQKHNIALWYEVPDTTAPMEEHHFQIFGTGDGPIGDHLTHIATVGVDDFALVLHVYEVTGTAPVGAT